MRKEDVYKIYFHGPAYQVVERAWRDGERIVGAMARNLPADQSSPGQPTLASPRLIELCFQIAGLWEISVESRMGLPRHIDKVRFWESPKQAGQQLYAVVVPQGERFNAEVVDSTGKRYVEIRGYCTAALPTTVDAAPLMALKAAA